MGPWGQHPSPQLRHRPGVGEPMGTPYLGGRIQPREGSLGVGPPMAPPLYPRVFILVSFTSKFTGNLEWMACKLITSFLILFHVIILHDYRFFWEIASPEEVQDSNSSLLLPTFTYLSPTFRGESGTRIPSSDLVPIDMVPRSSDETPSIPRKSEKSAKRRHFF